MFQGLNAGLNQLAVYRYALNAEQASGLANSGLDFIAENDVDAVVSLNFILALNE